MHIRIIEACIKAESFPVVQSNKVTLSSATFQFRVCSPLDPANPLYCILIWSIYTIYVSGKLGQGGEHI